MALPDLIEIAPLTAPVRAEITVPGSKSITNRALILAALADGEVTLTGALWSEDTQVMTEALKTLGFEIKVENDPDEFCNRTITVKGLGGKFPSSGTGFQPVKKDRQDACPTTELFVGNAGTAARFLAAFVCLGDGVYRLSGVPRMHERPQAALFSALRELGYRVESENGSDKLPVKIWGKTESGKRKAETRCKVSIEDSSQFASALLLSSKMGGWEIEIVGENAEESPYVAMTSKLMEAFPKKGGTFQIEPDASSGSYFWAAGELRAASQSDYAPKKSISEAFTINIVPCPKLGMQVDARFQGFMIYMVAQEMLGRHTGEISRKSQLGDSIMTAIVISPLKKIEWRFTDLGRLRVQECERVVALRTELTKCGAKVIEEGDTLTVYPSQLHGAEIETYNDHRMAMCFAVLGLKVPGIKIKNPACVKKTFPNFFQKLAAAPPHGLGAEIWEIKDGQRSQKLSGENLFAD